MSRGLLWPGVLVAASLLTLPGAARVGGQTAQTPAEPVPRQGVCLRSYRSSSSGECREWTYWPTREL